MKIDVDGPELIVLQSAKKLLQNPDLKILMEWDKESAKISDCNPADIIDILHQNDSLGAPVNFLTQGPIGLKETPLLQVFGLDNLNAIEQLSDDVLDVLSLCGLKFYGDMKNGSKEKKYSRK